MTDSSQEKYAAQEKVLNLLGLYKAEWLNGQLFELYTEPKYLTELRTKRPCVLIGGRGTGKTTVLRGLSYQGQFAMSGADAKLISTWPHYGLYYRVNTNRVMAFKGPELSHDKWVRCFAHYVNLILCDLLLEFLVWYRLRTQTKVELTPQAFRRVQDSLFLPECKSVEELADALDSARIRFEAAINNVADAPPANLSMPSAPVDALAEAIAECPEFAGKHFFFLLDEYENFEDYQQQVVNTFIKHASTTYTFKIGVRELGWRERATLNPHERLTHPADYARINIREKFDIDTFREFAARVCNGRLARVAAHVPGMLRTVEESLPGLSEIDEAVLLGADRTNDEVLYHIQANGSEIDLAFAREQTAAVLHLIRFWSEAGNGTPTELIKDLRKHPKEWKDRYNNYMHCALFTVRRGKGGIRKYYAGWDVLTRLADGNIRFLLELVHQSYLNHFEAEMSLNKPIKPKEQTEAAQQVGRKALAELEGISVEGGRLTKLLLSLGRVFQVLAETPEGHTPEVTQFYIEDPTTEAGGTNHADVERLLKLAVMHQALVRSPGNKLLDEADTREYDYRIHPVFAPFFGFSYRQKRKLKLKGSQLLGLISSPRETIKEILANNNRAKQEGSELPDQLRLFEGYYHGD